MAKKSAALKMQASRVRIQTQRPYLATALFNMNMKETHDIPAPMGIDKHWRIYYNPALLEDWTVEEMATCWYHEVLHLIRSHPERTEAKGADPLIMNVAMDCEINDDLKEEGLKLHGSWDNYCLPRKFNLPDNKVGEYYYEQLIQKAKVTPPPPGGGGHGPQAEVDEDGNITVQDRTEGSGAHGGSAPWEEGPPTKEKEESGGTPGITTERGELLKRKVAEEIQQHSKSRGDVPAHLKRTADELVDPKVNWRKELQAWVRNAVAQKRGMQDFSRSKVSRRQSAFGKVLMPAMVAPECKPAIVVDTSGSMGGVKGRLLTQAVGEVSGILKAIGSMGAPVLAVDAEVSSSKTVRSAKQVDLSGGGGTDMTVGIEACKKLRPRPDICVVLTDGYTPWPDTAPPFKVVACILGECNAEIYKSPEWIKRINVSVDEL